jgi:hypothetical protein
MTRRTYCVQPQRLAVGKGYVPCEPHQACRVIVLETTFIPRKLGRRAYQTKRIVGNFSGSGMMMQAKLECNRLTGRSQPKPQPRGVWGRSLTIAEYDEVMRRSRETGSY